MGWRRVTQRRVRAHSVYETQAQSPSRFQRFSLPGSFFLFPSAVFQSRSRSRARGEEWRGVHRHRIALSLFEHTMLRPKRKHVFSFSLWFATFRRFLDLAGRMRKLFAEDMGRPPRMQRLAGRLDSLFLRSGQNRTVYPLWSGLRRTNDEQRASIIRSSCLKQPETLGGRFLYMYSSAPT